MKKTFFYFFVFICFFAISLASCEKPETGDGKGDSNDTTKVDKDSTTTVLPDDGEVNDSTTTVLPDDGGESNDSTTTVLPDNGEEGNDSTTTVLPDVVLPEGTVRLQALNSQYATGADMGYSNASHNFLLMFATEECEVVMGQAFGNGGVLVFELFSATADNLVPAEGIYKIEDMAPIEDGMIVGGFDIAIGTPIGSYKYNMENDEFVSWDLITGGAMQIQKTGNGNELEIYIYTVFEDGTEANYYYKGELLIKNISEGL